MPLQQEQRKYTYADYLSWDEDVRIEIINGELWYTYGGPVIEGAPVMQATPSRAHQECSRNLFRQIDGFLTGKPCNAYYAPFSVQFEDANNDEYILEPDIVVVCDSSKLNDKGCKGAPDLVVEILSPSTARKDRIIKFQQYQRAGVREYWILDPDTKTLQACILENSRYFVTGYTDADTAAVNVLPGCQINLKDVFAE